MANSPLQYLTRVGTSVTGTAVQLGNAVADRTEIVTFLTESAITAGQVVAFDVSKIATDASGGYTALTVIRADYNSATVQKCVAGVALESVTGTATVPAKIRIVVRGPAILVPVVAATAVGDPLCLDEAGAAGSAQVYVAASVGRIFAVALTAAGGAGTVTAYVYGY